MPHDLYEVLAVRGTGAEDLELGWVRLGPWDQPCDRFRVRLTYFNESIIDVPEIGGLRWSERDLPSQVERVGGRRVRSVEIQERMPCDEQMRSLFDADDQIESVYVAVTLDEPLPPAFTPYRRHPRRQGELSFQQILERLLAERSVRLSGVHESAGWWAFGVWQIGSCGFAVSRTDARITHFGSSFPWEDWIWGHERGLVTEKAADLVIESVRDIEASIALLDAMRIGSRADNRRRLASPPVAYPRAVTWRHIWELRYKSEGAFRWKVSGAAR